jgi:predicted transposase YbfD/YdcC
MIEKEYFENLQKEFNKLLNQNEGQKLLKLLKIDGKTQRGNGNEDQKPNHIVDVIDENGFSIKEEQVDDKSNEITAIPKLLETLNIKGHIITMDAMGTQRDIAALIRKKRADYVLALKGNQGSLFREVKTFFADPTVLAKCAYHKTSQRARGVWR